MKTKSSTNPVILILLAVSTSAVTDFKGYEGCLETKGIIFVRFFDALMQNIGKIPFVSIPIGCFGYPKDCVESNDCKVLVTYSSVQGENQVRSDTSPIYPESELSYLNLIDFVPSVRL